MTIRPAYRRLCHGTWLQRWSLRAAIREQGLWPMMRYLEGVVPDIADQYTSFRVDTDYLRLKVRGLHAFQMGLVRDAIAMMPPGSVRFVVDVGDSSGTHTQYVRQYCRDKYDQAPICWSVNWDPRAVSRIVGKGLDAKLADIDRANYGHIFGDMALCFETLEHLEDPIGFLRSVNACGCLVMTVPWVTESRAVPGGGSHESAHCFELSPIDWQTVLDRAGWRVVQEQTYRQYPRWRPVGWVMRGWWARRDYKGFWGCIAEPRSRTHE